MAFLSAGIDFETEEDLREAGTARTPDILLSSPIAISTSSSSPVMTTTEYAESDSSAPSDWKIICWIDSKALFGDVHTHNTSVLPQAESYVHRFGPGLILYWFGHAPLDRLDDAGGDLHILGWQLPETMMLATGKMISSRNSNKPSQD